MFKNLEKSNIIRSKTPWKFDWWIEICTDNPLCIYYFGAFESFTLAESAQDGYILDLLNENAKIISVKIQQCQPQQLTVEIKNKNKALYPR